MYNLNNHFACSLTYSSLGTHRFPNAITVEFRHYQSEIYFKLFLIEEISEPVPFQSLSDSNAIEVEL